MPGRRKRRRVWRWVIGVLLGAGGAVLLIGVAGWLAFQRVPAWYQPLDVAEADLARVQNSLPNTYQQLNARINEGQPFEIAISDRTITEWVVARGDLYPGAREWLPDWIKDPVIKLDGGECTIAARIDYEGWQTIIGLHVVADVTNDAVTVRVARVTAGALPVPLSVLTEPLARILNSARLDVTDMPDPLPQIVSKLRTSGPAALVEQGVTWRNLFEWANGRRVVKLRGLSAADGVLHARLEPR